MDLVGRGRHFEVRHLEDRSGRHVEDLEAREDDETDSVHVVLKRGKFVIQATG
ncbi:hypothetical protein D3C72_1428200 [compost metagenome]